MSDIFEDGPFHTFLMVLRAINVGLLAFAALGLYVRFADIWGQAPKGLKITCTGIVLIFIMGAYGSAETYVQNADTGPRIIGIAVCSLLVLTGLWMSRNEQWFTFDYGHQPQTTKSPNSHGESSGSEG